MDIHRTVSQTKKQKQSLEMTKTRELQVIFGSTKNQKSKNDRIKKYMNGKFEYLELKLKDHVISQGFHHCVPGLTSVPRKSSSLKEFMLFNENAL